MAKVGEIFVGARFGRLEVVGERTIGGGPSNVVARCDCGVERSYQVSNLGKTTFSCGCLSREQTSTRSQTHCLSKTVEYQIWSGIVKRCTNPKFEAWHNYGGRGIRICDEWRYDFVAFLDHVGRRPGPEFSIDRIDNDGNYEPGNVRWATAAEQRANQRMSNVCKRGHPLVGDNVLVRPKQRQCKKCTRQNRAEYERARRRKKKEAATRIVDITDAGEPEGS